MPGEGPAFAASAHDNERSFPFRRYFHPAVRECCGWQD